MRILELNMLTDIDVVRNKQTFIKEANRATLMGWLIQTHGSYKLFHDTLFVAQMIIDKFMEREDVPKSEVEIMASGALYVASKYNDIDFIDVHDIIEHVKDVSREQVLDFER